MKTELVWITPNAEDLVAYMARVSNPNAQPGDPSERLIKYLIDHKHWSPFEMVDACVSIETTRDIGRQILRHRAFSFQEFSQRYAEVLDDLMFRECRLQDKQNRQNSIVTDDEKTCLDWQIAQQNVWVTASVVYQNQLKNGIAKEQARALLPEGLTSTRMYMKGNLRDLLFYLSVRTGPETQKEHREVAQGIQTILEEQCPVIFNAAKQAEIIL